jgi:hypothetical protein
MDDALGGVAGFLAPQGDGEAGFWLCTSSDPSEVWHPLDYMLHIALE